jgi:hypothetical protein
MKASSATASMTPTAWINRRKIKANMGSQYKGKVIQRPGYTYVAWASEWIT